MLPCGAGSIPDSVEWEGEAHGEATTVLAMEMRRMPGWSQSCKWASLPSISDDQSIALKGGIAQPICPGADAIAIVTSLAHSLDSKPSPSCSSEMLQRT
eukprot:3033859-Amphidinium_carterae.1